MQLLELCKFQNRVHLQYLFIRILHGPIQGDLGGKINILKEDRIGHGQKKIFIRTLNTELLPIFI
jgi:hypothetical protein